MIASKYPSLPNSLDIPAYTRVVLSGGVLAVAGDADEVGTTIQRVASTDAGAAIVPRNECGVRYMIAGGAISKHAEVFAAASGRIAASGTRSRGIALEAASGAGSVIPVLRT